MNPIPVFIAYLKAPIQGGIQGGITPLAFR